MYNRISVCPDGHLLPESDTLGRVGEHNATVLRFTFFEELNGKLASDFQKFLVVLFVEGEKSYPIDSDNEFEIPSELTESPELLIRVDLKKGEDVIFKSEPKLFTLADSDIVPPSVQKKHPLIGDIDKLKTKNKENLVEAINEIYENGGGQGGGVPESVLEGYVKKSEMPKINIDDVLEATEKSINLYEPTTEGWIDNTYIQLSGETKASNNYCVSPKIAVAPNTTYSINSQMYGEYLCYDSNDNYIGYSSFQRESEYVYGTTKENTAYIRLNISKDTDLATTIEKFNAEFMLVEGIGIATSKYGFKSTIREIGDLNALDFEDEADKKNLVVAINALKRFSTFTDEVKTEIAEKAVEIIDTALLGLIG